MGFPLSTERYDKFIHFLAINYRFRSGSIYPQDSASEESAYPQVRAPLLCSITDRIVVYNTCFMQLMYGCINFATKEVANIHLTLKFHLFDPLFNYEQPGLYHVLNLGVNQPLRVAFLASVCIIFPFLTPKKL